MSCCAGNCKNLKDNQPAKFRPLPVGRHCFKIKLSQSEHGTVCYEGFGRHFADYENTQVIEDQNGGSWSHG